MREPYSRTPDIQKKNRYISRSISTAVKVFSGS
jgi:hypothetical protein